MTVSACGLISAGSQSLGSCGQIPEHLWHAHVQVRFRVQPEHLRHRHELRPERDRHFRRCVAAGILPVRTALTNRFAVCSRTSTTTIICPSASRADERSGVDYGGSGGPAGVDHRRDSARFRPTPTNPFLLLDVFAFATSASTPRASTSRPTLRASTFRTTSRSPKPPVQPRPALGLSSRLIGRWRSPT